MNYPVDDFTYHAKGGWQRRGTLQAALLAHTGLDTVNADSVREARAAAKAAYKDALGIAITASVGVYANGRWYIK